jgi:CarD-like/TRCF domain
MASFCWMSSQVGEFAVGDLVVHSDHGIARYWGRTRINEENREFLELEFADNKLLYVPDDRSGFVQKVVGADLHLTSLEAKRGKWPQLYCIEALPNTYEWPGIAAFPELPQRSYQGPVAAASG